MILTYKLKLKDCDVILKEGLESGELVREELNFKGMTEANLEHPIVQRQVFIDEVDNFIKRHIMVEIE